MNISEILENMSEIQSSILEYIDNENNEEDFQNLQELVINKKIQDNKYDIISVCHLISIIADNHHRKPNFFTKIDALLDFFKDSIKKNFSNTEIFNLFKNNKRILLFLVESKIIIIDEYIVKQITNEKYYKAKYPQYFLPEIKPFAKEEWFLKSQQYLIDEMNQELPENFYENRRIGENESYLCNLIRQDSVIEFIQYVNRVNYSLHSKINPSIYETNRLLLKKQLKSISLIEYASFFDAIQIFRYLKTNEVKLTPSIWIYSIHGNNPETIHFLEENDVPTEDGFFKNCYLESIKCHHNDFSQFFISEFLQLGEENTYDSRLQIFKYHNYSLCNIDSINQDNFYFLCKYDYPSFVKILLQTMDLRIVNKFVFYKNNFIRFQLIISI